MNILLKSARIIDKNSKFNQTVQDILIEKGKIKKIAKSIEKPKGFDELTLEDLHVSPGWFDPSVSFGEPGFEDRETIEHGLVVAAKSGFTAVALQPNTKPFVDHRSAVEFLVKKADQNSVNLFPIANLSINSEGKELAELYDMSKSGAIAFGDYNHPVSNANLLKVALQYVQNFDGMVISFPEDQSVSNHGFVHEGVESTRLGLKAAPSLAEELQVSRDLFILEYTGGKLHIPTISTAKSVQLIKEAKKKGLQVSCSVSAHHLNLDDRFLKEFDSDYKVTPPLRSKSDCKALIKGVKDGTIDFVTSDHNPIDVENKKLEIQNALYGTIGLESFFGSLAGLFDLDELIDIITNRSRKVFGLESPHIIEGEKADLSLFNPNSSFTFGEENMLSKSKNSIFKGQKLKGNVYGIINNNQLIKK